MIRFEASTIVNAPVERVWEFMSDLDTMTQWGPGVIEVELQRPIGIGSAVVVTARRFGRRTINMKITDWEPNRKIGVETKLGRSKANAVITMEPVEEGKTRLSRSAQAEIGGLLRFIQPYVSYRMKRGLTAEIGNVKRILETQGSDSAAAVAAPNGSLSRVG